MEYFIREEKFEAISKKINSIKNKCEKLGLPFKFDILGEEFRNIGSDRMPVWAKFIKVDVEGRAFIADYEAVAVASCTTNGNVIRKINYDVEVPERYYHSGCICEHCNSDRYRKEVLIIRNVNTNEYKQVGKACCKLYTGNLDAQWVAMLGEFYDTLAEEEQDGMSYGHFPVGGRYYPLDEVVETAYAIIRKIGYFSSNTNMPTKVLTSICMNDGHSAMNKELKFRKYNIEFCGSDFDGVEELRRLAFEDLDRGLLLGLTETVREMEEKGLLIRSRSHEDERVVTVTLTEKGTALQAKAADIPEKAGACVRLTPEEAATLYGLLYKIIGTV